MGDTFIFIILILPVNERGSVDHLSGAILVRCKRVAKLSLERSEIFRVTTVTRYVNLSVDTLTGQELNESVQQS